MKKDEPQVCSESQYKKHYQNLQYSPIIEAEQEDSVISGMGQKSGYKSIKSLKSLNSRAKLQMDLGQRSLQDQTDNLSLISSNHSEVQKMMDNFKTEVEFLRRQNSELRDAMINRNERSTHTPQPDSR